MMLHNACMFFYNIWYDSLCLLNEILYYNLDINIYILYDLSVLGCIGKCTKQMACVFIIILFYYKALGRYSICFVMEEKSTYKSKYFCLKANIYKKTVLRLWDFCHWNLMRFISIYTKCMAFFTTVNCK